MLCLDFDPTISGHVMVGAKSGMYEFQDGKFVKHYTTDNSALESPFNPPSKDYTIVTSVKYDAAGNLWALNSLISNSIKCLSKSDGNGLHTSIQNCRAPTATTLRKPLSARPTARCGL